MFFTFIFLQIVETHQTISPQENNNRQLPVSAEPEEPPPEDEIVLYDSME